MRVICKDGTTIECQRFRAIESGVLLFKNQTRGDKKEEKDEEASGFIPITELKYILPEGIQPGTMGTRQANPSQPPAMQRSQTGMSQAGSPSGQQRPPQSRQPRGPDRQ